jgi:hypothetical protein
MRTNLGGNQTQLASTITFSNVRNEMVWTFNSNGASGPNPYTRLLILEECNLFILMLCGVYKTHQECSFFL